VTVARRLAIGVTLARRSRDAGVTLHNLDTMFRSAWSWLVPLVGATAVFSGVLLTTPPGFRAITDVVLGSPRGAVADAAAYALGAAASLALVTLVLVAVLTAAVEAARHRLR
jgi:hypothetical protein